jgi:hypothetical protein
MEFTLFSLSNLRRVEEDTPNNLAASETFKSCLVDMLEELCDLLAGFFRLFLWAETELIFYPFQMLL